VAGPPSKARINTLAVLVISGFLAVIAFSVWLSTSSRDVFGPTVLVADKHGHVYLNISTTLYHLDAQGHLLDKVSLPELDIQDTHLTDLLVRDDGTLLIGSSDSAEIFSCRLQQRQCERFLTNGPRPASSFKMTWDDDRNRLIVVDGAQHRILTYDEHGTHIDQSKGGKGRLLYPNTPMLTDGHELVVADTNHHRLVALDAATLSRELWELPVRNKLGNLRRIWPTDLVRTRDGNYWVIIDDDLLENGDILLFDSANTPLKRVDLPADWDPIKMRARSNDVLLAGFGSVELVSVSLDGETVQPFGDTAFRSELAQTRERRQQNDSWWQLWIWVAIFPLLIMAGSAAWVDHRLRKLIEAAASMAGEIASSKQLPETEDGIYWLQPRPAAVKMLHQARWAMYALPVLLLAPVLLLFSCGGVEKTAGLAGLLLAALLPVMAMSYTSLASMGRGRLGVTDGQIVLSVDDGPHKPLFPQQLAYGHNFISSGDVTIYTRTGRGPIYDKDDMQNYVEPRLKHARKLNAAQGYLFLLQEGDRLTWTTTIGILWMAGLYGYVEYFLK
jgi:hypothetical protein